jgi:predicted RND superfamily exporter protein
VTDSLEPGPALDGPPPPVVARNLALGIERIGFIPLSHRFISVAIFVVLCIGAAFGFARLKVDDSLSQLFRSDTAEYRNYEEVTRRFPSNEFDVLVVVEGEKLLERSSLEKLRDLVIDLQLIDGTRGLISMFSARQPPTDGGVPAPLFPNDLPEGAAYKQLIDQVMSNEIISGKLLSTDGKLALIVLALDPAWTDADRLSGVIGNIRKAVSEDLADSGLRVQLSGVPVMQLEIRNAIQRDRLVYNTLGFIAGCLIAVLFFRRISFMIIAAAPPLGAILLSLGALGWLDFRLNMFLNVMTPLIMVISFSDSMQLTFAARDRLLAGDDKYAAFRNALLIAGPACVLTHATAGISFIALQFSESDLIRTFGEAGLIATVIAMFAVIMMVPALGVLLIHNEAGFVSSVRNMDHALDVLRRFCSWIAIRMVSRPGFYTLIGVIVVVVLSHGYSQLQPRYRPVSYTQIRSHETGAYLV